jgi:UDP-N-acetyl-alpha-D-quinovosamine dehydrogenase
VNQARSSVHRILVTGADGFIGSALTGQLEQRGFAVRMAVRTPEQAAAQRGAVNLRAERVTLTDYSSDEDTKRALKAVDAVVHLAARVHIMSDRSASPLDEFRRVNLRWTGRLARLAAVQGVRRFLFLSSVKVNGERTTAPFTEQDPPSPEDPYAMSKWEAEKALAAISTETGIETVIVRSPLVYGPDVRGNFLQLLKVIRSGIPLPFAGIRNQRSLIYRENLADALIRCMQEEGASGKTYLVSDGEDLSTPELIGRLADAMRVRVRLWRVPARLLLCTGRMMGKGAVIGRLVDSLQVDSSKIRHDLSWTPPFRVERGLQEAASWFLNATSACPVA